MAQKNTRPQVHANFICLGSGVMFGSLIFISVLFLESFSIGVVHWLQTVLFLLLIALVAYLADSLSETLTWEGEAVVFDSLLRRKRTCLVKGVKNIILFHEGLNLERGIESIRLRFHDGHEERLSLGPLWQRHHLKQFLSSIERSMGRDGMIEEVH